VEAQGGQHGEGREQRRLRSLEDTVQRISDSLERAKIAEYVDLLNHPWRLIHLNLIAGLARGVGLAVGFTLLGAMLIYVLTRRFVLDLPLIGNFLGELVWIIQEYLKAKPRHLS
jgi:hypothetical protein